MGRRTSSGRVGAPGIGGILAENQTITTDDNADIVINPTGTGRLLVNAHTQVQSQSSVRFGDADDSNYVALQAPDVVAANTVFKLPSSDGDNGQVLQTNGTGDLTFVDAGVTVSTDNTDSNLVYPVLSDVTDGTATSFEVATSKLRFQASTGTVYAPVLSGGDASGNDLCLRSTTNGTKGQVIVTESTASSSTTSGALRVVGGMGVGEDVYVGGTVRATGDVYALDNSTGLQAQISAKADSDSVGTILFRCHGCWGGSAIIPTADRDKFHHYEIHGSNNHYIYYCSMASYRWAGSCGGSCQCNAASCYCCSNRACGYINARSYDDGWSDYQCDGTIPWMFGCGPDACRTACARDGFQYTMKLTPINFCCGSVREFNYCNSKDAAMCRSEYQSTWSGGCGNPCCGAHSACLQGVCFFTQSASRPWGCYANITIIGYGKS